MTVPGHAAFLHTDHVDLVEDPIEPSWILEGQPRARSGRHSWSRDEWATTVVWECSAGRFTWEYGWDESVYVLEGEVHLTSPTGEQTTLRAGDLGYFPAGTRWTWQIDDRVRKVAFNRRPTPASVHAMGRLRTRVGSLAKRVLGR
jgi:uncharacterized cupin superfamily protein